MAWVREQLEGESEIQIPVLAKDAIAAFAGDQDIRQALYVQGLYAWVYEMARTAVGQSRGAQIIAGDTVLSRDGVTAKANLLRLKWHGWLEHAGDRHILLMDMAKPNLLVAAAERQQRGDYEMALASLWRALAEPMQEGEKVGDRFRAEDIQSIWTALNGGER